MKNDVPEPAVPGWNALILVCKDCRKRSSGPKGLKPRALALELKQTAREARVKTRVVLTTCLGLCPKRATAVAVATGKGAPVLLAIVSLPQAAHVAPLL